jgi:hypothetical protein
MAKHSRGRVRQKRIWFINVGDPNPPDREPGRSRAQQQEAYIAKRLGRLS